MLSTIKYTEKVNLICLFAILDQTNEIDDFGEIGEFVRSVSEAPAEDDKYQLFEVDEEDCLEPPSDREVRTKKSDEEEEKININFSDMRKMGDEVTFDEDECGEEDLDELKDLFSQSSVVEYEIMKLDESDDETASEGMHRLITRFIQGV